MLRTKQVSTVDMGNLTLRDTCSV